MNIMKQRNIVIKKNKMPVGFLVTMMFIMAVFIPSTISMDINKRVEQTIVNDKIEQCIIDGKESTSIGNITIYQIADSYNWGYWCGVKQPLGAYKDGLSIHLIVKPNYPPDVDKGNPDHIFWVNEFEGTYGFSEYATGQSSDNFKHPGGMVWFDDDGIIWCNIGARAHELPLDVYKSTAPFDVENFEIVLDNYETYSTSTTPCIVAENSKVLVFWRHGWTTNPDTTVRMRRYNTTNGDFILETELDIGKGAWDNVFGQVGLEQFWIRFDPRFEYVFASWQWWDTNGPFGSLPFVYSDDYGDTWRTADGVALDDLPVDYSERTDVLIPYDHFELGGNSEWNVRDIGVAPGGTFWITVPIGDGTVGGEWKILFWLFNDTAWESRGLTGTMIGQSKPHAIGATKDYLVFLYSEWSERNLLKARVSADDGYTWTEPVVIDEVPLSDGIPWISFVQPTDDYTDNTARFFYSHYNLSVHWPGFRCLNSIKWVSLEISDGSLPGDINNDGVVDVYDLNLLLAAWGQTGPPGWIPADINGDGIVNIEDLSIMLANWN